MKSVNIGCGFDVRKGWTNIDIDKDTKADIIFDLNDLNKGKKSKKLPIKDNQYDLVYCADVLEHFNEPLPILREMYRICRPGGILEIKVPYGNTSWVNLDHRREFCLGSFDVQNFDFTNKYK